MGKINQKYYLGEEISDKELENAILEILESGVYDKTIIYASERGQKKGKMK